MEFYVNLNLKANQELNLGLDSEHLLLLTFLMDKQKVKQYQNESISENGNIYFWLSPKSVGNDLPILTNFCKTDRAKIDKIRGMYKNLIDLGFMEAYHKNQEIAKAYYTFTEKSSLLLTEKTVTPYEKNSKSLTKKSVSPYDNLSKPLTEKTVSNSNTNNSITNNSITISKEGEKTPPTIENVNFDFVASEKYNNLSLELENADYSEIENKANNLPLEEKKEKEKKVAAKKEKKEKIDNRKYLIEVFPNEESFAAAWGFKYGAKYPNIDASKAYAKLEYWSENKRAIGDATGKKADWLCTAKVWYEKEESAAKRSTWEVTEKSQTTASKMQAAYDRLTKTYEGPF